MVSKAGGQGKTEQSSIQWGSGKARGCGPEPIEHQRAWEFSVVLLDRGFQSAGWGEYAFAQLPGDGHVSTIVCQPG